MSRSVRSLVRAQLGARVWAIGVLSEVLLGAVLHGLVQGWMVSDGLLLRGRWVVVAVLAFGFPYTVALLLWRAVCRGKRVRVRGGVVEVMSLWRWRPVGRSGEVSYEVEPWRKNTVAVWLSGPEGRRGFSLPAGRSLEDSASPEFWEHVRSDS